MKNKSTIFLIIIVILLAILAYWLYPSNKNISELKPNSNFSIKNTNEIGKIVIRDIDGSIATLSLKGNEWYINNKYKARPENIELIMKTVKRIKVQRSVKKTMIKTVIADIASRRKKVDFYTKTNKLIKTYYIGTATQDHYGTFMLLETPKEGKSSVPYIMQIPGFNGFLESRFFANEAQWKYTGVFNYELTNIKSIKVQFTEQPNESYIIENNNNRFILQDIQANTIEKYNNSLLQNYVINYKKIHYNAVMNFNQQQIDSVKAITPNYIISVTDIDGNTNELKLLKKTNPYYDPSDNNSKKYDVNNALGYVNNNNEIEKYQYFVIDKLLMKKSYFTEN